MNSIELLNELKKHTEDALKELILPVQMQSGDTEPQFRCPEIYITRLPDSKSARKKAPYVLHQVITIKTEQQSRQRQSSQAMVRTIFCCYCDDEQDGGLNLLNMMERFRISILEKQKINNMFALNLESGVESLVYPEDSAPFFAGEMVTTWHLPEIYRTEDIELCR